MTAKRSAHQHARVVTAFVKKPEPLEDGKVRCAGCGKVVGLSPNGHLRRHQTPAGEPCAHTATYAAPIHLDDLPPVVIPPPRQRTTRKADEKRGKPANRERANNACVDCGKWLPGERKVCGQCYVIRDANRGK